MTTYSPPTEADVDRARWCSDMRHLVAMVERGDLPPPLPRSVPFAVHTRDELANVKTRVGDLRPSVVDNGNGQIYAYGNVGTVACQVSMPREFEGDL